MKQALANLFLLALLAACHSASANPSAAANSGIETHRFIDRTHVRATKTDPKAAFCSAATDLSWFQERLAQKSSRLAFINPPGDLGIHVCWWHSRLQRAGIYLTVFYPKRPKPSQEEAAEIVRKLDARESVVEIPGYHNLLEFSDDWEDLMVKALDEQQLTESFIQQEWLENFAGFSSEKASSLQKQVEQLYTDVNVSHKIVYQMLQVNGLGSHAWLVYKVQKSGDSYKIYFVESNSPEDIGNYYTYTVGDTEFDFEEAHLVPYTEKSAEYKSLLTEVFRYCNPTLALSRWKSALGEAYHNPVLTKDQGPQILSAMAAANQGKFTPYLRQETLSDDEIQPDAWKKLIRP